MTKLPPAPSIDIDDYNGMVVETPLFTGMFDAVYRQYKGEIDYPLCFDLEEFDELQEHAYYRFFVKTSLIYADTVIKGSVFCYKTTAITAEGEKMYQLIVSGLFPSQSEISFQEYQDFISKH